MNLIKMMKENRRMIFFPSQVQKTSTSSRQSSFGLTEISLCSALAVKWLTGNVIIKEHPFLGVR
jgi:hypothetical protein